MIEKKTKSARGTQKVAIALIQKIVRLNLIRIDGAVVIALEGNLGSGKTTFAQGFARALGIKENVLSPTFVLMKVYELSQGLKAKGQKFKHLIHIDCYRLDSSKDLIHLGFKNIIKDKDAIILIEWADRVRRLIPKGALWVKFRHGKQANERSLKISV